jgi:drug/metabolite transporter (DMT)-like permease
MGCTFFLAAAQVLLKIGRATGMPLLNWYVIIGMALYVIFGLIITFALKHGELSVVYPVISLGFIWVTLASYFWLHETLALQHVAGTLCIVAGISIIGHKRRRA